MWSGRWPRRPQRSDRLHTFVSDLQLLHDILAETELATRYWMWGGLLLGWARERRPLAHDLRDADFAFRSEDVRCFEDGARALMRGGFAPVARFINHAREVTEYTFMRNGAKFEFFAVNVSAGRLRYYVYYDGRDGVTPPTEACAEIAAQPLETFRFLGRRWLKQRDHVAELTELYGDWRTPDPDWWYMDERAIFKERRRWNDPVPAWDGELPVDTGA